MNYKELSHEFLVAINNVAKENSSNFTEEILRMAYMELIVALAQDELITMEEDPPALAPGPKKYFQKPIDFFFWMCYNIYTIKKGNEENVYQKRIRSNVRVIRMSL